MWAISFNHHGSPELDAILFEYRTWSHWDINRFSDLPKIM